MGQEASLAIILRARDEASATIDKAGLSVAGLAKAAVAAAAITGVALLGTAAASVKMAADFQYTTETLVTGAGESQKALGMVRQGILDMAAEVGQGPQQLAQGMYLIESAGFHAAAGLTVLEAAAKGATVGAASMESVSDALTSALNAYRLPATEAAHITDIFLATVAAGKMHMSDLAENIGKVLPVASLAHIRLSELSAAVATMTAQGTDAAMATTGLRFLITNLISPSKEAANEMKLMGLSAAQLAQDLSTKGLSGTMAEIEEHIAKRFPVGSQGYIAAMDKIVGGTRGLTAALELSGPNMKTFQDNANAIAHASDGAGKMQEGWAEHSHDFNIVMDRLKAGLEAVMITIGNQLLPVLSQAGTWFVDHLPAVQDFVNKGIVWIKQAIQDATPYVRAIVGIFDALRSNLSTIGPLVGAIVGAWVAYNAALAVTRAIGIVSMVLQFAEGLLLIASHAGLATTAQWLLNAAMDANPIGIVVLAIAALVGGLILAYQHIKPFHDAVDRVWNALKGFFTVLQNGGSVFDALGDTLMALGVKGGVVGVIVNGLRVVWDNLTRSFQTIVAAVMPALTSAWAKLQPAVSRLGQDLQALWPTVQMVGQVLAAVLLPILGALAALIGALLSGVFSALVAFLTTALPTAITLVVDAFQIVMDVFHLVADVFKNVTAIIMDIVHGDWSKLGADLLNLVTQLVTDIVQILGDLVIGVVHLFLGLVNTVSATVWGFVQGVVGFFQWLWDTLVGHSIIPDMINAIVKWFTNLPGWIMNELGKLPGLLGSMFINVVSAISGAERSVITAAIGIAKSLVAAFMNEVNKLPGQIMAVLSSAISGASNAVKQAAHDAHVPGFASGAVIRHGGGGIVARVGEGSEDEVVATASQMAAVGAIVAGMGGGPQTIIVPVQIDGKTIAQVVATYQGRQFTLQGGRLGSGAG